MPYIEVVKSKLEDLAAAANLKIIWKTAREKQYEDDSELLLNFIVIKK